ncbi:MAG: NAD(P)H-dependent oxidoreductase [Bacteroidetes bacterium]|nr:NAD(P)H-dependent oxidoreductase [Bacteroidota bacterium]
MITIISGTNRKDSMTLRVANLYYQLLKEKEENVQLLNLEGLEVWERGLQMQKIELDYLIPAEKFVFVMPEYNGSFPGILKLMIDNSDIRKVWWYKKAMLVGVADGRAGNLRGLDHMTNILHYMRMHVLYNKIPISRINEEVSELGEVLKPATLKVIQQQIDEFLKF